MNWKPSTSTRVLIACLVATLAFPAVAGATFQAGDSPRAVRHENGPVVASPSEHRSRPGRERDPRTFAS